MSENKAVRNLVVLRSKDNKYNANIGCYNGSSNLTIFSEGSNVPGSIWLSDTVKYLMKKYLKEILKNKKPSISNTIVSSKWNKDTKTLDRQGVLSINTDEEGLIYIGVNITAAAMRRENPEIANRDIKLPIVFPSAIDVSSANLSLEDKNVEAAWCVLEILENKLWAAEIATVNTDPTFKPKNSSQTSPSDDDDDIPF